MTLPAHWAALGRPGPMPAVSALSAVPGPVVRYRFVVADDPRLWPASSGAGGLLGVDEADQLDGFDRLTGDGSALVVICGVRQAAAVRRASALARSRGNARIAVVALSSGPVGQDVLAAVAQMLVTVRSERPASEIVAHLPVLAAAMVDLGLVSGVSKIDQIEVMLRHHVMSYWPGRRLFAVQVTPDAGLARITSKGVATPSDALLRPGFDDSYPLAVTVVGNRPVPEVVLALCGVTSVQATTEPTTRRLADFWGDPDATEVVVMPADVLRWLSIEFAQPEVRPCSWCGEPLTVVMDSCSFCGNVMR